MNEAIEIGNDVSMQIFDNFIWKFPAYLLDWVDELISFSQDLIL